MGVERCIEELRAERQRLQDKVTTVKAELNELEAQFQRVDDALEALAGNDKAKRKKKSTASVKTREVLAHLQAVLSSGPLGEAELCEKVADQLRQEGKPLTGYKLRFAQALKDASLKRNGQLVALANDVRKGVAQEV